MVSTPFDAWSHSPSGTPAPPSSNDLHQHRQQSPSAQDSKDKPKKPRHRHSAWQLAALNELYDRDEHPPLEARTSLAEKLGMEVKTVNAWFQNKRASSKKRTNKGGASASASTSTNTTRDVHKNAVTSGAQIELPPISALIASVSAPSSLIDDYDSEDEQLAPFLDRPPMSAPQHSRQQSAFYAGNPQHRHLFETESSVSSARKGRSRPSAAQTEELRKLYDVNPHPSKEEREELGVRIAMRYQSVTNWFQNQRSIAKKRKEDQDALNALTKDNLNDRPSSRAHTYSPFPPSSSVAHPSLSVPPVASHSSLGPGSHPRARRPPSVAPIGVDSRGSSPRPSPYSTAMTECFSSASSSARARRTRPEPYQLEALKKLFHRTATPSIEERGALALEINMDVGKVTNWFRNLRQSSRKRSKLGSGSEDDDDDMSVSAYHDFSTNVSRSGSPASTLSDERDPNAMDTDYTDTRVQTETEEKRHRLYTHPADSRSSDMASEEDVQEAVTPSPASSPRPAFPIIAQHPRKPTPVPQIRRDSSSLAVNGLAHSDTEKPSAPLHTGVKFEDALLLLSFSHNTAR
ncbi:hypothetical protein BC835DRAFT_164069 [Cytidiella melzeri]|nr:hypothetical protein BC835DRAFT_164069 [Cytidiella melzeri]